MQLSLDLFGEKCYVLCSPKPMALSILMITFNLNIKENIMSVNIFKIDFKTYFEIIHFFQFSDYYLVYDAQCSYSMINT